MASPASAPTVASVEQQSISAQRVAYVAHSFENATLGVVTVNTWGADSCGLATLKSVEAQPGETIKLPSSATAEYVVEAEHSCSCSCSCSCEVSKFVVTPAGALVVVEAAAHTFVAHAGQAIRVSADGPSADVLVRQVAVRLKQNA
jgi:hypothetical protein